MKFNSLLAVAAMGVSSVVAAQLPSATLSAVGKSIPGLGNLGIENLVLGGPNGFEFPFLVGSTDPALTGGGLFDEFAMSFPGLAGLDGGVPGLDVLPGIDQLPVGPELLLQLADPSIAGDLLTFLADPANNPPPTLPVPTP